MTVYSEGLIIRIDLRSGWPIPVYSTALAATITWGWQTPGGRKSGRPFRAGLDTPGRRVTKRRKTTAAAANRQSSARPALFLTLDKYY